MSAEDRQVASGLQAAEPAAGRLAREVVEALIAGGVLDFVLAPGSRSGPIALALAAAERAARIRLVVRIDERGAAFLAVGLSLATGRPVAVVCTSGTAVANLHPAVVEASYGGVPLVCVTADRPPELRHAGANQTIDQIGIFGSDARLVQPLECDLDSGVVARSVADAVVAATNPADPGPVQINVGLREPLLSTSEAQPTGAPRANPARPGTSTGSPRPRFGDALAAIGLDSAPVRGAIILGDCPDPSIAAQVTEFAAACGWPVLAEPSGNARGSHVIDHFPLILASEAFARGRRPDLIVTVGRFGLSRPTLALVRAARRHVAVWLTGRDRPDPLGTAALVLRGVPVAAPGHAPPDGEWLAVWRAASAQAARTVEAATSGAVLTGMSLARLVVAAVEPGERVLLGASRAVRDVQDFAPRADATGLFLGNRGASGIDGLVSTAWGVALGSPGRTLALMGDLAFLHDCNALAASPREVAPDLTIVVADNNGGGIFSSLEAGAPTFALDFDRVFGTPHDRDLVAVAQALGVDAVRVSDPTSLAARLAQREPGVRVVVAQVEPRGLGAELRAKIASEVVAAVDSGLPRPVQGDDPG